MGQSRRGNLTQTQPFIENPLKSSQTPQLCQRPSCPTPTGSIPPTSPRSSTGSAMRGSLGKLCTREELEKLFPETLLKKGAPYPQVETSWEKTMTWAGSTRRCREEQSMHGLSALPLLDAGGSRDLSRVGSNLSAEEPFCLLWLGLGCRQPGLLSWGGGWLETKRQCQFHLGESCRMRASVQAVTFPSSVLWECKIYPHVQSHTQDARGRMG